MFGVKRVFPLLVVGGLWLVLISIESLHAREATTAKTAPGVYVAEELLREPTAKEWQTLTRFDGVLTRKEFEAQLDQVFDPRHGIEPYLRKTNDTVSVFATPDQSSEPLTVVRFRDEKAVHPSLAEFRSPADFTRQLASRSETASRPLMGLRIALEPADIGGKWAQMEDRSVAFPGFGRINEGDIDLAVAKLIKQRLAGLGAVVFMVREKAEPVTKVRPDDLLPVVDRVLKERPTLFPEAFRLRTVGMKPSDPARNRIAAELLLTKAVETRARASLVRANFKPDLTIVIQHNATPESTSGGLVAINRNIFFVHGAYTPQELGQPAQRLRLLTKLFQGVTATETAVAAQIAEQFKRATGFPPVLYGNSDTTRLVLRDNPYVVARNIAFNREHDGPVVVVEPYYMNQKETLVRLLAGDYSGERIVAGKSRISIYREYAEAVVSGVVAAYGK